MTKREKRLAKNEITRRANKARIAAYALLPHRSRPCRRDRLYE